MATLISNGKAVRVQRGDTLSQIAQTYKDKTGGATYGQLASWNGIQNPNLIYIDQVIWLTEKAAKDAKASKDKTASKSKVTLNKPSLKSTSTDTLVATWTFLQSNKVEKYKVEWCYYIGGASSPWTSSEVTDLYHTYTIPDISGITQVEVRVTPIIKSGEKLNVGSVSKKYTGARLPAVPSGLKVTLEGTTLKAEVNNYDDPNAAMVRFEYSINGTIKTPDPIPLKSSSAALVVTVALGNVYKVRCYGRLSDKIESPPSDWSDELTTIPSAPKEFTECSATSDKGKYAFKLVWPSVASATEYYIEYVADNEEYFSTNKDAVKTKTVKSEDGTTQLITGDIQKETWYYFRVKAHNDKGDSDWSATGKAMIAKGPAAPTAWSSSTVVGSSDPLTFYWVHNSEDGSVEKYANLVVSVDGVEVLNTDVQKNELDAEKGVISSYSFKMIDANGAPCYPNGGTLKWKVRTAGLSETLGEPTEERIVQIYTQPVLSLIAKRYDGATLAAEGYYLVDTSIEDYYFATDESVEIVSGSLVDDMYTYDNIRIYRGTTKDGKEVYYWIDETSLTSFPINITASVNNDSTNQTPITYHIRVIAKSGYDTVDDVGYAQTILEGTEIYSKHFDGTGVNPLEVSLSAGDLRLANGASYTIVCTVAMSSGITTEDSCDFSVSWEEDDTAPEANVEFNSDSYTAIITPYCSRVTAEYRKVIKSSGKYVMTNEVLSSASGSRYTDSHGNVYELDTGEPIYKGMLPDGSEGLYCIYEESTIVPDFMLSVYRREYDGSFTELATNLPGSVRHSIIDQYPSLDYARYRIVAVSTKTGSVSYYDTSGVPVGVKSIIIQWDEPWSNFDGVDDAPAQLLGDGSMIVLPYNVDVSSKNAPEVSLVKYIGRKHPVAYYGTQMGENATWNTVIPKSDRATLYALRRLQAWAGDVYVREPSGTGYRASINVTFSEKHNELTIPVSFTIVRVEGGT